MTDLRDAARQALEALEYYEHRKLDWCYADEAAITALRAALAEEALQRLTDVHQEIEAALEQPEQEPVAWIHTDPDKPRVRFLEWRENEQGYRGDWIKTPLFNHPPRREWRGLTEEEITDGRDQLPTEDLCGWSFRQGVEFAEAALKERNV